MTLQLSDCCKAPIDLNPKLDRPECYTCIECGRVIGSPLTDTKLTTGYANATCPKCGKLNVTNPPHECTKVTDTKHTDSVEAGWREKVRDWWYSVQDLLAEKDVCLHERKRVELEAIIKELEATQSQQVEEAVLQADATGAYHSGYLAGKAEVEEAVRDVIKMADALELECGKDGDKGTKQWMAFKGFRNTIRDKYLTPNHQQQVEAMSPDIREDFYKWFTARKGQKDIADWWLARTSQQVEEAVRKTVDTTRVLVRKYGTRMTDGEFKAFMKALSALTPNHQD